MKLIVLLFTTLSITTVTKFQKEVELTEDAMKNMHTIFQGDDISFPLPLVLPHDTGDGNHSLKQFLKLFRDKRITKFEITEIFEYIDKDQSTPLKKIIS